MTDSPASSAPTYAIIGSGQIGCALAGQFQRAGIDVRVANSRGPDAVAPLAAEVGSRVVPATVAEALAADVVIIAAPFAALPELIGKDDFGGRILVDASNAIDFPAFTPTDLGGKASSRLVAEAAPSARLVKGFNTLAAAVLAADPRSAEGQRLLFLSGDDRPAVAEVAALAERLGFATIDLGPIDDGGRLAEFGGPLVLQNLVKSNPR